MSCAPSCCSAGRAKAWADMMKSGQPRPTAQTQAAPWALDFRASAWAAMMTRGQMPAGAVESKVTHRCGGRAGADPCPHCGGNIRRAHPAHQALAWGLTLASMRQGLSAFWRGITASRFVFNSDLPKDESTLAMRALLTEQLVHADGTSPMHSPVARLAPMPEDNPDDRPHPRSARAAALERWNPSESRMDLALQYGDTSGECEVVSPEDLGPKCCVLDFQYPVPDPTPFAGPSGPSITKYFGWYFFVSAQYKQDPTDRGLVSPCDCACCEFRQYVAVVVTTTPDLPPEKDPSHDWAMDCAKKGDRIVCPGSRDPAHNYGDQKFEDKTRVETYANNGCKYLYQDRPFFEWDAGSAFTLHYAFMGVIYDRCNNWAIKEIRMFSLDAEGKLTGDLSDVKPPEPRGRGK